MNLRLRFQVLTRDRHTCQYCGAQAPDAVLEVDHVLPRSAGGDDSLGNLVTACRECNQGKRADLLEPIDGPSDWDEWPEWEARLLDIARRHFGSSLEMLLGRWRRWSGEEPSAEKAYRIGCLLLSCGYGDVREAMRVSAIRHGYAPSKFDEDIELGNPTTERNYGYIDIREVHNTLTRWTVERIYRDGD